jgi:DNA-binding CsgD family transcriptional regulator
VEALVARTGSRVRALVGACEPLSTPRPFGPFLDVATVVGGPLLAALSHESGAVRIPECILGELQAREPSHKGTLMVIEDAHWADAATLDVLRYLARRVHRTAALVVVTYRDDALGRSHPLSVLLGDLAGQPGVHSLSVTCLSRTAVEHIAAAARSPVDVAELYRITGGNPFYVTEVLAAGNLRIPQSVSLAALARRARLSAEARVALDAFAVLGPRATLPLAAALLGPEPVGLEECLENGALHMDGDHIAFRHELARTAVHYAIPRPRLMRLHRAAMEARRSTCVRPEDLDVLAEHAEYAQDGAAVLVYAPRAAQRADALGAHREAAAQYARALRFASDLPGPQRADLLERCAYQCYLTSQMDEALAAAEAALLVRQQTGETRLQAADLRWCSRLQWATGHSTEAWQAARAAQDLLEHRPADAELGWAYSNLSQLAAYAQDAHTALPLAGRAVELGERFDDPNLVLHARTNAALARLLCHGQGWDDLQHTTDTAAASGAEEGAARGYATSAWIAVLHRDRAHSVPALARGAAYCTAHDLDSFGWFLHAVRGLDDLHHGSWASAADAADAILRRSGLVAPMHRLFALTVVGLLRARRGEPEAWPLLDEALRSAEAGDLLRLAPVHEARAEVAWLAGDGERTRQEAAVGLDAVTEQTDPWLAAGLARWCIRAGAEPPSVRAAGPLRLELARSWAAAAEAWDDLDCPYDAALARLEGPPDAVEQALGTFQRLGADAAARLAAQRLRAAGVRQPRGPRPATRADPHGLTSRQLQVLELLRQGLSDADIADRLVISPKTASHHVAAILAKYGVRSRHQLPAAELGSLPPKDG